MSYWPGAFPSWGLVGELMAQIVTVPPPPPSQFRPQLDLELESICLKALAKKPAERFASMEEFAAALDGYLQSMPLIVPSQTPAQRPARSLPARKVSDTPRP